MEKPSKFDSWTEKQILVKVFTSKFTFRFRAWKDSFL